MTNKDRIPEMADEVKSKINDSTGTVIAKYFSSYGEERLDVRSFDNQIYYATNIANWEVVRTREEIE